MKKPQSICKLFAKTAICALLFSGVGAQAQPLLNSTNTDSLLVDVGADGEASRGDTIRYNIVIENTGTNDAISVIYDSILHANMTLVPGSVKVYPIALPDAAVLNLGGSVVIDVLANDRDVDGTLDPATVAEQASPTEGSLGINPGTGEITYTSTGVAGPDSFTYTVDDNESFTSNEAQVDVLVNTCPVAQDDDLSADEDTAGSGDVLADNGNGADSDADSNTLTVTEVNGSGANVGVEITLTSGALLTVNADGTYDFDPNGQFESLADGEDDTDSFTYTVNDGVNCSDSATATITINGANDCPVAQDDGFSTDEDTAINEDVLVDNGNGADSDVDTTDTLNVTAVNGSGASVGIEITLPSGALLTLNANGTFDYDPNGAFDALVVGGSDSDTFTYTVSDGTCPQTATVTIDIDGLNDCPIAQADDVSTDEDNATSGDLFANNGNGADSDADTGDTFTITAVNASGANVGTEITLASGALLTVNADGTFDYDPNGQFESLASGANDTDTFTYTINDGDCTDTATVTVTVNGVNDCPVAQDDDLSTDEDTFITGGVFSDNGNGADSDVDNTFTVTAVNGVSGAVGVATALPSGAQITLNSNGTFNYNPLNAFQSLSTGEQDTDSFTYTISDGSCPDTATVTITVDGISDAPIAAAQNTSAFGNIELVGNAAAPLGTPSRSVVLSLKDGAIDPDTLPAGISVVAASGATTQGGTFASFANGSFRYMPPVGFTGGNDTFTYQLTDGVATSNVATVTIAVSNLVWFINNGIAGTGGTGTTLNPFRTITDFNNANGDGAGFPAVGHRIFIRTGAGNYTTGINLLNTQTVEGEGVALIVATETLLPAAIRPVITSTTNHGVTLASGNTLSGFNITNTPGFFKISGSAVGALTLNNLNATGTGGAINITTSGTFGSTVLFGILESSSSPASAINLTAVTGTLGVFSPGTGISGSANTFAAINISGGSPTFTYSGTVSKTNAGHLISIVNTTAGSISLTNQTTGGISSSGTSAGVLIDGCAGSVLIGTASGFNDVGYVSLTGAGGITIQGTTANPASGTYTIQRTSINGVTGAAFTVNGDVSGTDRVTANITCNDVDITNPGGRVADIQGLGAPGSITFDSNSFINRNNSGQGIACNSNGGGVITFNQGTKTLTTGSNNAVSLTSNTGALISFTNGNLAINTTSGTGFNATGGGTVTVTGASNSITTTTGTAVNLNAIAIGSSNIQFQSVTSIGGSAPGIVIQNTTGTGGVSVTGVGTTADSGGTIATKSSGVNGDTATGTGIHLNSTSNISLSNMQINDHANFGIRGTSVNNFRLTNCDITGNNGSEANGGTLECAITFFNVTGAVNFVDNEISGGFLANIYYDNSTGTTNLNFLNNNVHNSNAAFTGDGFLLEADTSATVLANVSNNVFTDNDGDDFNLSLINNAVVDFTFNNNDLNGAAGKLSAGLFVLGASFDGSLEYDISNNNIQGANQGAALFVNKGSGTATYSGQIFNNVIGNPAVNHSGALQSQGIHTSARGAGGSHTTLIDDNEVYQYHDRGIVLEAGEGSPTFVATLTDNTVSDFADAINSLHGIHCNFGILGTDNAQVTVDVRNNLIANSGNEAQGGVDLRMRTGGLNDVFIAGYSGGNSAPNAQTFIDGQNPDGTSFSVTLSASGTYNNGPAVPLAAPDLPELPPAP